MAITIRTLMVAVAVVALNLVAALATASYYPRPRPPLPLGFGNGRGLTSYHVDRSVWYSRGNAETGYQLARVERPPTRPGLLRIWSPVIASVAVSLLVMILATWPAGPSRRPRLRWAALGAVLIALNVAGFAYWPSRRYGEADRTSAILWFEGTVIWHLDGSVIGYDGPPGQPRSPVRVFRPPLRSWPWMWGGAIVSLAVTVAALVFVARRRSGERTAVPPARG